MKLERLPTPVAPRPASAATAPAATSTRPAARATTPASPLARPASDASSGARAVLRPKPQPPRPGDVIAIGRNPNTPNGGVIRAPFPPLHGPHDHAHPHKPKPGDIIAIGINPNTPNGGVIRVPYPDPPLGDVLGTIGDLFDDIF